MRAALVDAAEKARGSVNGHVNNCMRMMGKRQNMGGMSGKMSGAMISGQ